MAIGGGFLSDSSTASLGSSSVDIKYSGGAVTGELALGGTPAPGFVLAFGTSFATVPNPTAKAGDIETSNANVNLNLTTVGLLADYYFDPRGGAHIQALIGMGQMSASNDSGDTSNENPIGFAMDLGGGYEWWVGEQWGIGVLGRLSYGSLKWKDSSSDLETKHNVVVPALLLSATYH